MLFFVLLKQKQQLGQFYSIHPSIHPLAPLILHCVVCCWEATANRKKLHKKTLHIVLNHFCFTRKIKSAHSKLVETSQHGHGLQRLSVPYVNGGISSHLEQNESTLQQVGYASITFVLSTNSEEP